MVLPLTLREIDAEVCCGLPPDRTLPGILTADVFTDVLLDLLGGLPLILLLRSPDDTKFFALEGRPALTGDAGLALLRVERPSRVALTSAGMGM